MKERTLIAKTVSQTGQQVVLKGWVNNVRNHGKIIFFDLRDRTGLVQVVCVQNINIAKQLRPEWVVKVLGTVKERPEHMINSKIETGKIEIEAEQVTIIEQAQELPFDTAVEKLKVNLPTLLDYRPLSLRHPNVRAIFKVQDTIISAFRQALKQQDFTEIQVPSIVPTATEGGSQVFPVSYFEHKAYLAQSPQFYKQIMVGVFERVFTLAHAFRAEPSVTTRHLTEYIGLDVELGFIDSFQEVMDVVESTIVQVFDAVKNNNQQELDMFQAQLPEVVRPIPSLKMREAQKIIFERTGRDNRDQPDLEPEDEREICRWSKEEHNSDLIFITHYPTKKRPFYTFPDPEDPEFTYSFDLLGRGMEWVTGGQRINNYQQLVDNIKKWGNKPKDFEMYLQAFKYGMPPEGGFCLGAERITMQILGLDNIRQASLFPRDMKRIDGLIGTKEEKSEVSSSQQL